MKGEHFGIVVSDLLLSGAFVVAYNDAGPRDDILKAPSREECEALGLDWNQWGGRVLGALAETSAEYADALWAGLVDDHSELLMTATRVSRLRFPCSSRFGDELLDLWNFERKAH